MKTSVREARSRGRRGRRAGRAVAALAVAASLGAGIAAAAEDEHDLPAGPISERHELMEKVGDNAEAIGDALKAGKPGDAAAPAERIAAAVERFLQLFPPGSEDPRSRALPAIWAKRSEFDKHGAQLETTARDLAEAARSGGDVKKASGAMFKACKSCHNEFRRPEEDEE